MTFLGRVSSPNTRRDAISGQPARGRMLRRAKSGGGRQCHSEQLPLFEPISKGKESPMWSLRITARLTFFILLSIPHDYDKFYVEIAWSNDGEFPWDRHSEVVKAELP